MAKKPTKDELKPEWIVFAHEYVKHWNGTRSYLLAYPTVSEKTAGVNACKLLGNTRISNYIEEIQSDVAKEAGISVFSQLEILKKIIEDKKEQTGVKIKALEVVNKMLDFNAPEKSDIKVKGLTDHKVSINFVEKKKKE